MMSTGQMENHTLVNDRFWHKADTQCSLHILNIPNQNPIYRFIMNIYKTLMTTGFIIAIIGWCAGAFFDQRELAYPVFIVGWYLAAIGMMSLIFREASSYLGMKIGVVGFGVASLSGIFSFILHREDIANYIFYVGFFIIVIGFLFHMCDVIKNH